MASISRVIRIGRGKKVDASWSVRPELLELPEERALYDAYQTAASQVRFRGACELSG